MGYLYGSRELPLNLNKNGNSIINWRVDLAYDVN